MPRQRQEVSMTRRKAIGLQETDRFIADTHFGHEGIINMCARPFTDVNQMNRELINSWNSVVGKNHRVWHLGDFGYWKMEPGQMRSIFDKLNGEKHLIVGNHDADNTLDLPWSSVSWLLHFKTPDGLKIAATHHPQREWDGWFS